MTAVSMVIKIEVIFGRALDTIEQLDLELDFTFIDADKRNYLNYYKRVKEMTTSRRSDRSG